MSSSWMLKYSYTERPRSPERGRSRPRNPVPIGQLAPGHDRIKVVGERELQTLLSSGGGPDDPAFASEGGDAQNLVVFVAVNHEDGNGGCAVRPRDLRGSRLGHGGSVGA